MNPDMSPIEYIGSSRRQPRQGFRCYWKGWLVVLLGLGVCCWLLRPMVPYLQAQRIQPTKVNLVSTIAELKTEGSAAQLLAAEALHSTQLDQATSAPDFYQVSTAPAFSSAPAELIMRSYHSIGIDLPQLVSADMSAAFRIYPSLPSSSKSRLGTDHLQVPNLQRFFSRHGQEIDKASDKHDYHVGDLVVWDLPRTANQRSERLIGIIVPGPETRCHEPWVVLDSGDGPIWQDALFDNEIVGHYRYAPNKTIMAGILEP